MVLPERCERYIQNLRTVRLLSKPQFPEQAEASAVLETFQQNAVQCFDLMQENNALLRELVFDRDPKTLTDSDISELTEFAGRLFHYANSEDTSIAFRVHQLLLQTALLRKDTAAIVKEYYLTGVTLHYMNVQDEGLSFNLLGDQISPYFVKGSSYIAQYEQLDSETRQYILRCAGNMKLGMSRLSYEQSRHYLQVFEQGMGILGSPYYQALNPEFPWDSYLYSMHMDRMTLMERLRDENDPELAEEVLRSAEYAWNHQKNHPGEESRLMNWRVGYFYHAARFHAGRCPVNEPLDVLLDAVRSADPDDYSPDGINHNLTAAAYLFYYAGFLDNAGMRRYAPALDEVRRRAHHYLDKMPGSQYPRLASYAMWELSIMSLGTAEQEICQMLNSLLAGHKPTYVHSLMVAQLTKTLVRQLADTNPETLVGVLGCRNAAEVTARRDEICEEAYQCGLYHDVGKCALILYIGTNGRRLLAEEFLCIQNHPVIGYKLLRKMHCDPNLAESARYHHSYYDGSGGYPQQLPPCPASIKAIVDVLSAADSLDAATDHIGRCYNRAKPFSALLEEFRAQCGTRYSPAVVALFDDSGFCRRLNEALDTERKKVYLQVYHAAGESF